MVFLSAFLLFATSLTALASPTSKPRGSHAPTPNKVTSNVLKPQRAPASQRNGYLNTARSLNSSDHVNEAPLYSTLNGNQFLTDIQVNGVNFLVVVDTGSSDTWIVERGFQCLYSEANAQLESQCGFGPMWTPDKILMQAPSEHFRIRYADQSFAEGVTSFASVTLANITVHNQEIGMVNYLLAR